MPCDKFNEQIPLYLLGELDNKTSNVIKQHLKNCIDCQSEYEAINKTIDAVTKLQSENISELEQLRLQNSIYRSILENNSTNKTNTLSVMAYLTRTAAAILIFATGFTIASYYPFSETNQMQADKTLYQQSEYTIGHTSFKGYAHTSDGLKIIAKGTKQLKSNQ